MLQIEDLSFRYSKRSDQVLKGLSMELGDGQIGIIMGKNGAKEAYRTGQGKVAVRSVCSIEEGSRLAILASKDLFKEASEEDSRRQYDTLCKALSGAGYYHYEISNFALPGKEAIHNSAYWRRVPYVGFGPGAHSFDGHIRRWNSESILGYTHGEEVLTDEDIRVELIMLGLRTSRGSKEEYLL